MTSAVSTFVSTPALTISGKDNPDVAANLIAMTVEETMVGMFWCEIRLANFGFDKGAPGYLYLHRDVLDFGTSVAVTVGPAAGNRQIFAGKISALQADYPVTEQAQMLIFAEDGLQDLRLTRRTRTFDDMSTAEIAQQIASEHSLTPAINLAGPTRKLTAQLNQSDLAFLRSLARRDDGELWLDGKSLHLSRRPDRAVAAIDLGYGADLLSFSVRADLANQCSTVGVTGWDVSAKDAISETADANALGAELATGDTAGASVLATAFAPRTEYLVRAAPSASDDARALAKAAYLERARRFVCGTGLTGGTPALRVGATVNLTGLGSLFTGSYYVCRARHMFDLVLGYRTEFDVERAGIGPAS